MRQGAATALRPGQVLVEFFGGPMDGKAIVYDQASLREAVYWRSSSTGEIEVYALMRGSKLEYQYRHVPEAIVG